MKLAPIILLPVMAMAKPLVFDVCNPNGSCYTITTPDAKSWEWKSDYNGSKFVRVYLMNGILDIQASNLSVKLKK